MQYNSELRAQVAIVGHAIFKGGRVAQYVRPGIDEMSQLFAGWKSGAGLFTSRTAMGARQVHAIVLFRMEPGSDQATQANLLMADFADNPTTEALSRLPGIELSTLAFDSHSVPIPLIERVAESIYSQLYHQYHDGSRN
jgi:hypothetical protein